MTKLVMELFRYQSWADAQVLSAVKAHPAAAADAEILRALHHIVGVQRFFLSQVRNRPFDVQREMQVPSMIEELQNRLAETQAQVAELAGEIEALDLERVLDNPPLDQMRPTVGTALVQVVLHSQHHRGQVASRLRALGGTPPTVDYILWKKAQAAASA